MNIPSPMRFAEYHRYISFGMDNALLVMIFMAEQWNDLVIKNEESAKKEQIH